MAYPKNRKSPRTKKTTQERFWDGVVVGQPSECWEWSKFKGATGYGVVRIDSHKTMLAHRYSFVIHKGEIPSDKIVMHSCDNRRCVNPSHLSLGTNQDNMNDRNTKGRQAHGSGHYSAKLTEELIPIIREQIGMGLSPHEIAGKYGVSHCAINDISAERTWRHVVGGVS